MNILLKFNSRGCLVVVASVGEAFATVFAAGCIFRYLVTTAVQKFVTIIVTTYAL